MSEHSGVNWPKLKLPKVLPGKKRKQPWTFYKRSIRELLALGEHVPDAQIEKHYQLGRGTMWTLRTKYGDAAPSEVPPIRRPRPRPETQLPEAPDQTGVEEAPLSQQSAHTSTPRSPIEDLAATLHLFEHLQKQKREAEAVVARVDGQLADLRSKLDNVSILETLLALPADRRATIFEELGQLDGGLRRSH